MKTSIYKANGKSFNTFYELIKYTKSLKLRVINNSNFISTKKHIIHLIEIGK